MEKIFFLVPHLDRIIFLFVSDSWLYLPSPKMWLELHVQAQVSGLYWKSPQYQTVPLLSASFYSNREKHSTISNRVIRQQTPKARNKKLPELPDY